MVTCQSLSMMGTAGDMLPLLWSSATFALQQQEVTTHFVVQPCQLETVLDKLNASPRFTMLSEERIDVEQKGHKVTFSPPAGGPPKVERSPAAEEPVQVELHHVIWQAESLSKTPQQFHVWAPMDESFDEKQHQEWQDLSKLAFKKPSYGEYLTKWQVVLAHLDTVLPTSGVLRATNCYDQESNHKLINYALGYKCDLHLRIGTLSLMDSISDNKKFYAISQALCPRKLHLSSVFVKDVAPKRMELAGVIVEPTDTFPAGALPPRVGAFLLEEPTTVVTLSNSHLHLASLLQHLLAGRHCLFVCSATDAPLPGHLHWPQQLNLHAAFSKASLVVHACGVGTAYTVVCSGTPSICVALTKEQLNNAKRLEHKGVAVAFSLHDLMTDTVVQDSFVNSLGASFDGQCVRKMQMRAAEEGDGLAKVVEEMARMLSPSRGSSCE